jgi:hypothetical protein
MRIKCGKSGNASKRFFQNDREPQENVNRVGGSKLAKLQRE